MKVHRSRKLLIRVGLLCGSSLFSLLLLEGFLRQIAPPSPFNPFIALRPGFKYRLQLNAQDIPALPPTPMYSTNRWGMRGDEPPSDWEKHYTLITVGGSTTQCAYLDDRKTWPALLQARLKATIPNVWVGNGGLGGHSTRGHVIFMQEVLGKIRPSAVVLLVGVNDYRIGLKNQVGSRSNPEIVDTGLNVREKTTLHYKLYGSSRLLQILYMWKQIILDSAPVVSLHHVPVLKYVPIDDQGRLPEDLRPLLPFLDGYRENIRRIIEVGRSCNVRLIFLTQPLLYEDTPYWRRLREEEDRTWTTRGPEQEISCATRWRFLDLFNQELMQVCRDEHVECFDLAAVIPHRKEYFYDSMHFNERGAELVSRKVAEFFKSSSPIHTVSQRSRPASAERDAHGSP